MGNLIIICFLKAAKCKKQIVKQLEKLSKVELGLDHYKSRERIFTYYEELSTVIVKLKDNNYYCIFCDMVMFSDIA